MYKRKKPISFFLFCLDDYLRDLSAPIMMWTVRNITGMEFFFRVQRDREMSFAGTK